MDYYDIHLNADAEVTLTMEEDDSVMVFTLLGDVYIDGEHIEDIPVLNCKTVSFR